MTPDWLNDVVRAFGRQLELTQFALDARGVAGVRFENGLALRFEYAGEALLVSMGVAAGDDEATLRRVLGFAHPDAQRGAVRVRAAYLARRGEAVFVARLPERRVTVTALSEAFAALWQVADQVRRSVS